MAENEVEYYAKMLEKFIRDRDPTVLFFFVQAIERGNISKKDSERIAEIANPPRNSVDLSERHFDHLLNLGNGDRSLQQMSLVEDILDEAWNWSNTMPPMTKEECAMSRHFTENAVRDITMALLGEEILFYEPVETGEDEETVEFPEMTSMSMDI